jgi:hypothetical protein
VVQTLQERRIGRVRATRQQQRDRARIPQ